MTFEKLLQIQNDEAVLDVYRDNLAALRIQLEEHDSPMATAHYTRRVEAIKKELKRRGLYVSR